MWLLLILYIGGWSEDSKPQVKFTKPSHKTRHSVGQVKRAGGRVFRKKVT